METPKEICRDLRLEGNPYSIQAADWIEAYVKEKEIKDPKHVVGIPSVAYFNSMSYGLMWLIILVVASQATLLIHMR